ncbi:hypothetical protein TOTORO_03340 [Serratia phage vB_SmaS-Totoro]|nr:hypothetical protein TOTORO_03340 [Serratia phage vB_SmaS-Totoro]
MSSDIITEVLINLNEELDLRRVELSQWLFGEVMDIPARAMVASGLCHGYAKIASERLLDLGVVVRLVGSPTHVFLTDGDKYYDSMFTQGSELSQLTRWNKPLIEYDEDTLIKEFYSYREGLVLLRN